MAYCRVVRQLFQHHLRLDPPAAGGELDTFFCIEGARSSGQGCVDDLVRQRALGIYALYRTYNCLRSGGLLPEEIADAFAGFLREGRRGHAEQPRMHD